MDILCYDCGKVIHKDDRDREHIPAQCFYSGFGPDYKKNRITVDAHKACNQKYSKIDQELRDAIGISIDNQKGNSELTSKSIRSILRKRSGIERITSEKREMFVDFNYGDLRLLHIKNFKGIFYKEFGIPIPEKLFIEIITDGDQENFSYEVMNLFYQIVNQSIDEWKISGHKDIFKYKLGVFENNNLSTFDINSNEQIIFCVMIYHEEIVCFGFATTKSLIDSYAKE
jgi:hypothetical protein